MNSLTSLFDLSPNPFTSSMVERLGWVLLHSLWQFMLITIFALVVVRWLKNSSAGLRYAILVFMMAACVACPIATWFVRRGRMDGASAY
jgi:hypothetical protein